MAGRGAMQFSKETEGRYYFLIVLTFDATAESTHSRKKLSWREIQMFPF